MGKTTNFNGLAGFLLSTGVTSSVLLATDVQQQSKRLSCHRTVPQRATATLVATSRCWKVVPIGSTYCICLPKFSWLIFLLINAANIPKMDHPTGSGLSAFFCTFCNSTTNRHWEWTKSVSQQNITEQRTSREPLQTSGPIGNMLKGYPHRSLTYIAPETWWERKTTSFPMGKGDLSGENC